MQNIKENNLKIYTDSHSESSYSFIRNIEYQSDLSPVNQPKNFLNIQFPDLQKENENYLLQNENYLREQYFFEEKENGVEFVNKSLPQKNKNRILNLLIMLLQH